MKNRSDIILYYIGLVLTILLTAYLNTVAGYNDLFFDINNRIYLYFYILTKVNLILGIIYTSLLVFMKGKVRRNNILPTLYLLLIICSNIFYIMGTLLFNALNTFITILYWFPIILFINIILSGSMIIEVYKNKRKREKIRFDKSTKKLFLGGITIFIILLIPFIISLFSKSFANFYCLHIYRPIADVLFQVFKYIPIYSASIYVIISN